MPIDFDSTDHCGKCGYDLTGLPANGRCPECGQVFDTHSGAGLTRDPNRPEGQSWLVRHVRTVIILALGGFIFACGGLLSGLAVHPIKVIATAGFIAFLMLLAATASYLAEQSGGK